MPDALNTALNNLASFIIDIGWALLIAFVAIWLSRKVRVQLARELERRGKDPTVAIILDNVIRLGVYFMVALMMIGVITGSSTSTVTAIGLVTAALSLSLQDVIRNFVSGIYLLLERPFYPGDTIRVADQKGVVDRIDIRTTVLHNANKEEVFVPNFKVFSEVVRREPDFYSIHFHIKSPGPVNETFDAIWNAELTVQVDPSVPPSLKITGANTTDVDFEATIWQRTGTDQSEAFIAAVKTSLPEAIIRKLND